MSNTPANAQKLWCPMVRLVSKGDNGLVSNGQTGLNRIDSGGVPHIPSASKCIAGNCAMWRWVSDPLKLPITVGAEAHRAQMAAHRGYCGLAGKPND